MGRAVKNWTITFKLKFEPGVEKDMAMVGLGKAITSFTKASPAEVIGLTLRRKQKKASE